MVKLTPEESIKKEVTDVMVMEGQVNELQAILSENPAFKQYLDFKKKFEDKSKELWKNVQDQMIENGIKNIKSDDWGSITVAERINLDIDESKLPDKYFAVTRKPNKKFIADSYKLEKQEPKGVKVSYTKYLLKKFKKDEK